MAARRALWFLYLAYISKPPIDRAVYRTIRRAGVRKIVELGIGTGQRAERMIDIARLRSSPRHIHYTGIDLFEARDPQQGAVLPLKEAYRRLSRTGVRVQLLPGDPFSALSRAANRLGGTELLLISAGHNADSLAQTWFYVPRMLSDDSQVLVEEPSGQNGEAVLRPMARDEILRLTQAAAPRRAA